MIYLSDPSRKKVELIDEFLADITVEDLDELVSQYRVVGKLKGIQTSVPDNGIFTSIIQSHSYLQTENQRLTDELIMLKNDLKYLIKAVSTISIPVPPQYSSELQNLKSRYQVY